MQDEPYHFKENESLLRLSPSLVPLGGGQYHSLPRLKGTMKIHYGKHEFSNLKSGKLMNMNMGNENPAEIQENKIINSEKSTSLEFLARNGKIQADYIRNKD